VTSLLLTLFCLVCLTTCTKVDVSLVPLAEERVVGAVSRGEIIWEEGENPNGEYLIVTKALVFRFAQVTARCARMEKEIKALRAALAERKEEILWNNQEH